MTKTCTHKNQNQKEEDKLTEKREQAKVTSIKMGINTFNQQKSNSFKFMYTQKYRGENCTYLHRPELCE